MVYLHDSIREIRKLHGHVINAVPRYKDLRSYIADYAESIKLGFHASSKAVLAEISNYYKPLMGSDNQRILSHAFSDRTFLEVAANCHGFNQYDEILTAQTELNPRFEEVVDVMLIGDIEKLKALVKNDNELVSQSSAFGHKARLIHYCSSNAVEMYRQMVPENLVKIIKFLLEEGADPHHKVPVYGGEFDFIQLFSSSAHPHEAGVAKEVLALF